MKIRVRGGGCEVHGCVQARLAAAPWQWQSGPKFLGILCERGVLVILPMVVLQPCGSSAHAGRCQHFTTKLCVG